MFDSAGIGDPPEGVDDRVIGYLDQGRLEHVLETVRSPRVVVLASPQGRASRPRASGPHPIVPTPSSRAKVIISSSSSSRERRLRWCSMEASGSSGSSLQPLKTVIAS
jgi:hypothetical protein